MRTQLPRAGGLADQDARLLLLLEVVKATGNALFAEQRERQQRHDTLEGWRHERAQAQRATN